MIELASERLTAEQSANDETESGSSDENGDAESEKSDDAVSVSGGAADETAVERYASQHEAGDSTE